MRRLLFHRQFSGYTGGHGKVWDYFQHVCARSDFLTRIYLTPGSTPTDNPWRTVPEAQEPHWQPRSGDTLFLGGMDWLAYPEDDPARPAINLVQHIRHADPEQALFGFLARPAVRICVSQAVADAILATGRVNGPVHIIPAALYLPPIIPMRSANPERPRIFIGGVKDPPLAQALSERLAGQGRPTDTLIDWLPRQEYLDRMSRADIAVLLPHPTEGFFLPALEAMALGCAVIVPDCLGNREYARDGLNCRMPTADPERLAEAVALLSDDAALRSRYSDAGRETARRHTLDSERLAFHAVLDRLDEEWAQCRHVI